MKENKRKRNNANERKLRNLPSLVLLNSEGDILKVFKTEDKEFIILDEQKEIIATLNSNEIFYFSRGELKLVDSTGKVFDYTTFVSGMKPSLDVLDEFIGIGKTDITN